MNRHSFVARQLWALALALVCLASTGPVWGDGLPGAKPEEVGLSSSRLDRITAWLKSDVEKGVFPGAVALVARKGRVAYLESVGFRDKAAGAPMTKDAIFRVYSMTKPITSTAVMMLHEEGRFLLNDPVSKYIPELGKLQVAVQRSDPVSGQTVFYTVPAEREITIQDLLRHTSGLTYAGRGSTPVHQMYIDAGVDARDLGNRSFSNAELVEKLGKLPLLYQPGTTWEYGLSTDVLGRLVEVAAGVTLGKFFEERILKPLKMVDTGFSVAKDKHGRLAQPAVDPKTGKPALLVDVTAPSKWESGGGGAVSTADDYVRFAHMLLGKGQVEGTRILSRKSVELMTSDHLGYTIGYGSAYLPGPGYTFGLGFAVRNEPGLSPLTGSPGEFNWGGAAGTFFWVDPKEELVAIYLMQDPVNRLYARQMFKTLVLQAITD
jgi:CubicO group peptidase (beta-lactamase class C family)